MVKKKLSLLTRLSLLFLCLFSLSYSPAVNTIEDASDQFENLYNEAVNTYDETLKRIKFLEAENRELENRQSDSRADIVPSLCNGRLTLQSATPVPTSDQTSKATVYFTPYHGDKITLYSGSAWQFLSFTEKSVSVAGISANKNYDVFAYNNSGTVALELSTVWTDDVTRADALTTLNGVYVKNTDNTRRYLGTIRGSGAGVTEDSLSHRFVWNNFNRTARYLRVGDTTNSWTYNSATWRSANNNALNRVDFVVGMQEVLVRSRVLMISNTGTAQDPAVGGVGLDSTSTNSATIFGGGAEAANSLINQFWAHYEGYPSAGYHYLQWLESATTNVGTFYGDNNLSYWQSGLIAIIEG